MLALCLLLLTAAPTPLKVAVPNFNVVNVTPETAAFFVDRFANRLRSRGLAVTTATEIEAVLGLERQKQLLGCESETNCQAEIASALGADAIIRARIARFGQRFELSLSLIDPVNAAVLASISDGAADESKVLDVLDASADALSAKLLAVKRPPAAPPRWVSLVPLAVGLGAGVGGAVSLSSSFDQVKLIETAADPVAVANGARVSRGLGYALLGAGVAGLATAAILFFTGEPPAVTPVASLSSHGAWVGFEGRLP